MTDTPRPRIHEQVKSPSDIAFGKHFSDHMLLCHWDRETGWERPKIVPYGDIPLSPGLHALQYATEVSTCAYSSNTVISPRKFSFWDFSCVASDDLYQKISQKVYFLSLCSLA